VIRRYATVQFGSRNDDLIIIDREGIDISQRLLVEEVSRGISAHHGDEVVHLRFTVDAPVSVRTEDGSRVHTAKMLFDDGYELLRGLGAYRLRVEMDVEELVHYEVSFLTGPQAAPPAPPPPAAKPCDECGGTGWVKLLQRSVPCSKGCIRP
jgi:hypothetical protein